MFTDIRNFKGMLKKRITQNKWYEVSGSAVSVKGLYDVYVTP